MLNKSSDFALLAAVAAVTVAVPPARRRRTNFNSV